MLRTIFIRRDVQIGIDGNSDLLRIQLALTVLFAFVLVIIFTHQTVHRNDLIIGHGHVSSIASLIHFITIDQF